MQARVPPQGSRDVVERLVASLAALAGSLSEVASRLIEYHRERNGHPTSPTHPPNSVAMNPAEVGTAAGADGPGRRSAKPGRQGILMAAPDPRRLRAEELQRIWEGFREPPALTFGELTIDCDTRRGRFELLLLAVLYAARVQRHWAERALAALQKMEWTEPERLLTVPDADLLTLLEREYRGLVDRERKVAAMKANARVVAEEYRGDLNAVYQASLDEDGAASSLLGRLRQFREIGATGLWICRQLRACGVWPEVSPADSLYVDRTVRDTLIRLEFLAEPSDRRQTSGLGTQARRVIERFFDGDILPVYFQGRLYCENTVAGCPPGCRIGCCSKRRARSERGAGEVTSSITSLQRAAARRS